MYLKDMVGKLAIRTAEAFNPEPFPPVHLGFGFPVFSPKPGSTRKYMDEPVKIITNTLCLRKKPRNWQNKADSHE